MRPPVLRLGICDDHPLFRSGLRTLLAGASDVSVVFEVGSLAALRSALATATIDVLLLDLGLPDGSGLDLVAEAAKSTRVVVLSALDDPRTVKRALEEGATGYLRKDTNPDEVVRSLRRAAAGETVIATDVALALANSLRGDSDTVGFRRRVAMLTPRQREVLVLLSEGRSNREIGKALFVSEGTVKNHVTQILDVLGVSDRTRLAVLVARYGIGP